MKFNVPIHVSIEASSQVEAQRQAESVQAMLNEDSVKAILEAQGIKVQAITVYKPQPR